MGTPRKRLLWQLYPSYFMIILLSLVILSWHALRRTESLQFAHVQDTLLMQGEIIDGLIRDNDNQLLSRDAIIDVCLRLDDRFPANFVLFDQQGAMLYPNRDGASPAFLNREESQLDSLNHGEHLFFRRDRNMYLIYPVWNDDHAKLFLQLNVAVRDIKREMDATLQQLSAAAFFIILIAGLVGLYVSRKLTQPLAQMQVGAVRFARGELNYHLPVTGSEEMAALAESMNTMAVQLDERISQLSYERLIRQAVFNSLDEGLIVMDRAGKIIFVNRSGASLLGINVKDAEGRSIYTVVRNADLQRIYETIISETESVIESDVLVAGTPETLLRATGMVLYNSLKSPMAGLIVMQNVTHVRMLEKMRQDFVANVSHELRTPITSIKGFVETLLDGAYTEADTCMRFLGIVRKQVDHLDAIITDLLTLSRIEHYDGSLEGVPLENENILNVLNSVRELCGSKAQAKSIKLVLDCDPLIEHSISAHLFEQAIVNLVDNAIRFSKEGAEVIISASQDSESLVVEVKDFGAGIERYHLDRLFERFYRVDRGRNSNKGGTGLGLAIVKHVALVHGGTVNVDSVIGQGSCFRITIPCKHKSNNSLMIG